MTHRARSARFRSNSEMKQGDLDELTRNDEKVAIVKWEDSRTVLLASTCAGASKVKPVKRWSKKEKYIDVQHRKFSGATMRPWVVLIPVIN
ncbi:hypothetical protein HPB51_008202 [Rhipicephalus microplus]|uniref:PiggyBac transposable element-derived protein domain-containing protein n=1 Tax=Rhipicephalus microplus TaxID=6941 RepID=A0A9J6D8Y8_RHIMP|nr:hypothetical protein HPB51_008202 [Rhipicephalus microplus]